MNINSRMFSGNNFNKPNNANNSQNVKAKESAVNVNGKSQPKPQLDKTLYMGRAHTDENGVRSVECYEVDDGFDTVVKYCPEDNDFYDTGWTYEKSDDGEGYYLKGQMGDVSYIRIYNA